MLRRCVVVMGLLAAAACTKSAPEFYQVEADCSNLVSREGDDAYLDEDMDNILTRLRAINPEAKEGPRAAALLSTIESERARLTREKADAAKKRETPPPPSAPPEFLPPPPLDVVDAGAPLDGGAPDAGVKMPYGGMPEAEFLKYYGDCVEPGPPTKLSLSATPGTTQVLKKDDSCSQRLQAEGGTRSYVFIDGKLSGQVDRTVTPVPAPPPKPAPPAIEADAGERLMMRIPGAPTEAAPPQPQ